MSMYDVSSAVMQVLLVLLVALMALKLAREMASKESPIQWWHLIAVQGRDGKNYASTNKLWLNTGAVLASWMVVYMVLQVDWRGRSVEVAGIFGLYLMFVAGVEAYAKHLKVKATGEVNVDAPRPPTDKPSPPTGRLIRDGLDPVKAPPRPG